jgi:3-hydroxyisobutyrate dehydrogenase
MASSDAQLPPNIGFIGLGNMGFPMFSNLVSKLPETSTVHFYDVLPESMERGLKESGAVAKLDPCGSSREVVEKSVCTLPKVVYGHFCNGRQDACFSSRWSLTEHL